MSLSTAEENTEAKIVAGAALDLQRYPDGGFYTSTSRPFRDPSIALSTSALRPAVSLDSSPQL